MKRAMFITILLAMCSIAGTCQTTTHQAVLTWTASATTGATYNILRASSSTGPFTAIQTGVIALTYTDANLPANTQVCYEVSASAAGMQDSSPTNVACGTTGKDPVAVPGTLTITIK